MAKQGNGRTGTLKLTFANKTTTFKNLASQVDSVPESRWIHTEEFTLKLRLKENSIRLRLGQTEVRRLDAGETLEASLDFGSGSAKFYYAITPHFTDAKPSATFNDGRLIVSVSAREIRHWARSDAVAIRGIQSDDASSGLTILIEKDFKCLAPADDEPQDDAFPHPADSGSCAPS